MSEEDKPVIKMLNQDESSILKTGHIVKVDNSFNKTHEFNRLSAIEQNISWAIISMFSTGDTDADDHVVQSLTVNSSEIRNLAGVGASGSRITKSEYRKTINKLRHFFLTQYFVVHIQENGMLLERGTPVFRHFDVLNDGEQIYLELMPESTHFFSKIFEGIGFSVFALQKMIEISSPTAKILYRLFLDGKHRNGWKASYEELREEFGFKKRNGFYTFYRRLPDYINQVNKTGDFEILKFDALHDKTKRGNPITHILFSIKLKPDRIKKLVKHYHSYKVINSNTTFYDLSVAKTYSSSTNLKQNKDGTIKATVDYKERLVDIKCPDNCGGNVKAFVKKDGKVAFTCTNSRFWGFGSRNCDFYADEKQDLKLTDDIRLWIKQKKGNKDCSLAACLKTMDTVNAEESEQVGVDYNDDAPFPLG